MNFFKKMQVIGIITKVYLKGDFNMKNWKTSAAGILAAIGQLLPIFGVEPEVCNAVSVLGLALLGWFCKDRNVTGGNVAL